MITHPDAETNVIFAMLQEARDEAIVKCGKMGTEVQQLSAELTAAKAEIEALKNAPVATEVVPVEPEPVVPAPASE